MRLRAAVPSSDRMHHHRCSQSLQRHATALLCAQLPRPGVFESNRACLRRDLAVAHSHGPVRQTKPGTKATPTVHTETTTLLPPQA